MMRKITCILLISCLLFSGGCAELTQGARLMTIVMMEILRLPIYCMRLPFQILQGMGPIIQSAVRSAAQVAPLLLFIERRVPKDSLYAGKEGGGALEESVEKALSMNAPLPLLPLLEREVEGPGSKRFALVDARLMRDDRLRRAFLKCLGADSREVRCLMVDGKGIFSQSERFLEICRLMSGRGDSLFALTAFNDRLSALARTPAGALPPGRRDRRFIQEWNGWIGEYNEDADSQG